MLEKESIWILLLMKTYPMLITMNTEKIFTAAVAIDCLFCTIATTTNMTNIIIATKIQPAPKSNAIYHKNSRIIKMFLYALSGVQPKNSYSRGI